MVININKIIEALFEEYPEIRYTAIYKDGNLVYRQKEQVEESSSSDYLHRKKIKFKLLT